MKIKVLLSIGGVLFSLFAQAQTVENEENGKITSHTQLMEERISELMADKVPVRKDIALQELIEINERAQLLQKESLMFPAEELYGSHWDNKWVDPFQGQIKPVFPDSCQIDCSAFNIPIDSQIKVTSKYGPRGRRMHRGIDLKVQIGDTIRAAFDGKVRIRAYQRGGYGYYLVLRHPNGLETVYGHLSKFLSNENEIVRAGQPIGLGGNTGRSTGSHLHFETRFLGQTLNPADLIDFTEGVPHKDMYVFRNVKINGRKSNIYTSDDTQMVYHRVKSGDTLGKIARRYGTTINELCRLNGIKSTTTLRIGQSLRCSASSSAVKASEQTTVKQATVKATTAAVASLPENKTKSVSTEATNEAVYHKIQSGDTLGAIATKYGTTINKLCELNGIKRNTILRLGRTLRCS
ncbi:murein DD-endopeptidase MepM/ murein hydrolase activator NlpD [Parabacteroides sp. PFB2-12]|uniref:LysM peptidoglycan-binding domain-containing protein n=1 Tax=unclassified Parabacteroides TaxID=2649774 RepID=UPI002474AEEC|nr:MULTISPECIES: LysM peptidoglycan-binding domain-containing protein [unclassified Parabacteroides]MDH6341317.1 murein DD-endopeptidase MepM/ murein hydrolase activator NlpD [Parabacteroides sp. PM6-13]MDH6389111.1 murein DD-endopeptidase MepM/ murein hydrolase activator NlpD [Parabacteroides sp. PFB2-12]